MVQNVDVCLCFGMCKKAFVFSMLRLYGATVFMGIELNRS